MYEMTASPVELADGHIRVGNITFNPAKVLGKGCEGTFVYQVTVLLYSHQWHVEHFRSWGGGGGGKLAKSKKK